MDKYLNSIDATQSWIFVIITAIGLAGLLMPFFRYLIKGWKAKSKDIMDGLNAEARVAYFRMFSRTDPAPSLDTAIVTFDKFYLHWYGRWHFLGPGTLFVATSFTVVFALASSGLVLLKVLPPIPMLQVPVTALAAMGGAYLWVTNDLISRARRLDFAPADVQWATLRLTIAIPMGYAFAAIAAPSLAPLVAFGLGTFPLGALTSILSKATSKAFGQDLQSAEARNDIGHLQGVNGPIVERLANEGISTVTQMAYCDPVRLAMRSSLPFVFVTDCMNQALAWIYFEDQLVCLRSLGLRGACEIKNFMDDYDATDMSDINAAHGYAVAHAALPLIAAKLNQDEATVQIGFRQIAGDPYTIFLADVWT